MKFDQDSSHFHFSIPKNANAKELEKLFKQIEEIIIDKSIDDKVREWFYQQLLMEAKNEAKNLEVPDWVSDYKNWEEGWIPLLLVKQSETDWQQSCLELIESYLQTSFIQVKLSVTSIVLFVSNQQFKLTSDQVNELDEFALGLYELFQNESNEEIKVGIHYPVTDVIQLIGYARTLVSDLTWVCQLWYDVSLFAPWNHLFERIMAKLPVDVANQNSSEQWDIDHELLQTLDVFFEENLNMSETARRLFIHRNTLQYRIDKIKQQTGYDVKRFEDAMITKIHLFLIYKLHKKE